MVCGFYLAVRVWEERGGWVGECTLVYVVL